MGATLSSFFPPKPTFTEANLPSQNGKVFLVTGGYGGIGYELSKMLFNAGAKVYIAGRSLEQGQKAIREIQAAAPAGGEAGVLEFLHVDMSDLEAVAAAAEEFKSREQRLDVLFQNAGVSMSKYGSTSKQGHELMMATNVLGPLLLFQCLAPCLEKAAETAVKGSVRVVWAGSIAVIGAPRGGFKLDEIDKSGNSIMQQQDNYMRSKLGNWYLAHALAHQSDAEAKGVLHVVMNPGNLRTNLLRNHDWVYVVFAPFLYKPIFGAYTELYSGLSEDLGMDDAGVYIEPWGRKHPNPRQDLVNSLRSKDDGGTGKADDFLEWCWEQTKAYR